MKELVPYVNLETRKNGQQQIEAFIIRVVASLPEDSSLTLAGEGTVADNVIYRPLTVTYDGSSSSFKTFDVEFNINRSDVGLLERGVITEINPKVTTLRNNSKEGVTLNYSEEEVE